MMKRNIVVITILSGMYVFADTARLGVQVVDATSLESMENVEVLGYFDQNVNPWLRVKGGKRPRVEKAYTDKAGYCELEGETPTGRVWIGFKKVPRGYYLPASGWNGLKSCEKNFFGTWQPDDLVVTVKLERVENPIPLYVNRTTSVFSDSSTRDLFTGNGERAYFDMVKGDWLPPNGTGVVADVEFIRLPHMDLGELTRSDGIRGRRYRDSMEVRFLGEHNGLMEMPTDSHHRVKIKVAQEDGYESKYVVSRWNDERLQHKKSWNNSRCFCFRIRSRTDAEGKLMDGLYGKIHGDISFMRLRDKDIAIGNVGMQYYLNLTPLDRNLEWNGKNLCKEPRTLIEIYGW